MKQFGIIGYPLSHSFSARFFSEKFAAEGIDARYDMYPLESITAFPDLVSQVAFSGMNVTMPYKQAVIPYLDALDATAEAVGAVNVIAFCGGRMTGYNTDVIGFMRSIEKLLLPQDTRALVLGTGGASKAVVYALQCLGLQTTLVSRDAQKGLQYAAIDDTLLRQHSVVVNATPLGMYPDVDTMPPIPYELLQPSHLLFDLVYNPSETRFLEAGYRRGCRIANGMEMLIEQAKAAWTIWQQEE